MAAMFYIEHQTDEYMYIIDTGITEPTVRDDARNVLSFLHKNMKLERRRLLYRNHLGKINEIKHVNGSFRCFSMGHLGIELPPESEHLLKCIEILNRLRKLGNPPNVKNICA